MRTCLVVDDDSGQRLLTRLVVEGCGRFHVVGEAKDGREAIEMAGTLRPDLILLDLNMPRMGGAQALPALRRAAPDSTIYVLSTVQDTTRLHEARMAGAHGFLDKMLPNERLRTELVRLELRAKHSRRLALLPARPRGRLPLPPGALRARSAPRRGSRAAP